MSLGEYPTVVARVVAINDRSQQSSIIALLQEHYSMDAQDALEAVSNLPFKLPAAFFTVQEGRAAVRQLMGLGCEVTLKDLVSNAAYMTGKATVNGKTAVTLEFTAMLVGETQ